MEAINALTAPFTDYAFMKKALVAALALCASGAPLGVFMTLRRMTLMGDALSHAILPGIAAAFFAAGFSLWAMTLGGMAAALALSGLALLLARTTILKEDAAFGLVTITSLALGVALVAMKGGSADLMHLLFGNSLGIDDGALWLMVSVSCGSLLVIAALYRRFVIDGFDPDFLRVAGARRRGAGLTATIFFALLAINLIASFQALGTLMALGLMILPALAARFWARTIDAILPLAILIAALSSYAGLLLSYYCEGLPSGASIVLVAGAAALLSALTGRVGSVRAAFMER